MSAIETKTKRARGEKMEKSRYGRAEMPLYFAGYGAIVAAAGQRRELCAALAVGAGARTMRLAYLTVAMSRSFQRRIFMRNMPTYVVAGVILSLAVAGAVVTPSWAQNAAPE